MAKIEKPKARKEYKCSKCGETIKVGDTYLKGTPFRRSPEYQNELEGEIQSQLIDAIN